MPDIAHLLRTLDAPTNPAAWPAEPEAFLRALADGAGAAWIRVPGRDRSRTRVVATLLHGNEPSGARAVHGWLRSGATPAVDAVFFLGSLAAALEPPGFAHRVLFGHRDLNRCFLPPFESAEGRLAEEVLGRIRELSPEALIDLHNTTGHTPAYGVAPGASRERLRLTVYFADRFVESDLRLGALIEAIQDEVPAVVIECGLTGSAEADRIAREGLTNFLEADSLAPDPAAEKRIEAISIVGSPVRVCLQPGLALRYGDAAVAGADLTVDAGIDRHNFEVLAAGAPIGWVPDAGPWPFVATRADGAEVSREIFRLRDGVVEARRSFVPIMMTTDPEIAVQDCIFYAAQLRA